MSTGMVAHNSDTRALAAQVAQEHIGFSAAGIPSAGQNASLEFTPVFMRDIPIP